MLTDKQKIIIEEIINSSLDKAESTWRTGGNELRAVMESASFMDYMSKAEVVPSTIPGHPFVSDSKTVVDEFIAFVADMRKSSEHLMCAISSKIAKCSGLERVYYETSALLPALTKTIKFKNGTVTEYLGDGCLAFFNVDQENKSESIYAAYYAAQNSIGDTREIINKAIMKRYSLPPLDIGVGLSMSKALVTLVGLTGEKHPKAFGECVFRATKLSGGVNEIYTDRYLQNAWPSSKGGILRFLPKKLRGVDGFLLNKA